MERLIDSDSGSSFDPTQSGGFGLSTLEDICELILQSHDLGEKL